MPPFPVCLFTTEAKGGMGLVSVGMRIGNESSETSCETCGYNSF